MTLEASGYKGYFRLSYKNIGQHLHKIQIDLDLLACHLFLKFHEIENLACCFIGATIILELGKTKVWFMPK